MGKWRDCLKTLCGSGNHAGENGEEFIGLGFERGNRFTGKATFLMEEFQPKAGLVYLLESDAHLSDKFLI